jgi:hypothetical protein
MYSWIVMVLDGYMASITRRKYKAIGTCSWCPRIKYINPSTGHVYALCEHHHMQSTKNRQKRTQRPFQGLCVRCSKSVEYQRTLCEYHLAYERNRILNRMTTDDAML